MWHAYMKEKNILHAWMDSEINPMLTGQIFYGSSYMSYVE